VRAVLIGSAGMLAQDVTVELGERGHEVLALDLPEVDITRRDSVRERLTAHRPQVVINCAAYTAVDRAESGPRVNRSSRLPSIARDRPTWPPSAGSSGRT